MQIYPDRRYAINQKSVHLYSCVNDSYVQLNDTGPWADNARHCAVSSQLAARPHTTQWSNVLLFPKSLIKLITLWPSCCQSNLNPWGKWSVRSTARQM